MYFWLWSVPLKFCWTLKPTITIGVGTPPPEFRLHRKKCRKKCNRGQAKIISAFSKACLSFSFSQAFISLQQHKQFKGALRDIRGVRLCDPLGMGILLSGLEC